MFKRKEDKDGSNEMARFVIKKKLTKEETERLTRFEFFIRSHFSKHKVKEIIMAKLGSTNPKDVTDEMAIVVGSLAKLFCGELVETG